MPPPSPHPIGPWAPSSAGGVSPEAAAGGASAKAAAGGDNAEASTEAGASEPLLSASAEEGVRTAARAKTAVAPAAATGDDAELARSRPWHAQPDANGQLLHPLRRREVMRLYAEFKQQHADGVCKVDRFETLLWLKFPMEDRRHVQAMLEMVARKEAAEAAARQELEAVENDVVTIFEAVSDARTRWPRPLLRTKHDAHMLAPAGHAHHTPRTPIPPSLTPFPNMSFPRWVRTQLDTDGDGTVALDEFLRLERSCGLSRERLEQLFRERDADCSDDLTLDEFRALATEYRLFDHKQAIVHLGLEAKQEREIEQRFAKENLWKLGLPLEKLTPAQPLGNRPSLANIGEFIVSSSSCALVTKMRDAISRARGAKP